MATEPIACTPGRISARFAVDFSYCVHFTRHAFATDNPLMASLLVPSRPDARARVFVAVDATVCAAMPALSGDIAAYCRHHRLELAGDVFALPAGETSKTGGMGIALGLIEAMMRANLDRQSYLIAIGGGSVLDAAGLAAALLHRGIRLVRLPTTVLGQNDAGVGVKNGIDCGDKKNAIGTFAPPWAVVDDFAFLDALPADAFAAGFAEAAKVAMIESRALFDRLDEIADAFAARETAAVETVIRETARLHLAHIAKSGDPFETGTARPLDFGHWSAHRLEAMSHYRLNHGFAVAIGIIIDSFYAEAMDWIQADDVARLLSMLTKARTLEGARQFAHLLDARESLRAGLEDFRAHLGGPLTLTFPAPVGCHRDETEIDLPLLERAIGRARAALAPPSQDVPPRMFRARAPVIS
ncbi:MAG: 3-dehydroquinate synthase [Kiritimatiellia bacterium]